jgi:hypothetical protein
MADTSRPTEGATLVAVWPGMGQVAMTAGFYLMARLQMTETDPIPALDVFDVEHVDIKDGLVVQAPPPQGRLFLWKNPKNRRDVAVFIGEAQPPAGRVGAYCDRLLDAAEKLGVREVYTFASMATTMHPSSPSTVVGVATDAAGLEALRQREIAVMESGRITGLNGVFLAAAAQRGMRGVGLLGEIPAIAAQIAFPKAARAVLEAFAALSGVVVDLTELKKYEEGVERQLSDVVAKITKAMEAGGARVEEPGESEFAAAAEPEVSDEDRKRIEDLFAAARGDRSRSFELKRELDRLGVFPEYEDRFLDLFRKAG